MKILAKSRTLTIDEADFTPELLRAEAERVWALQLKGVLREIHFTTGGEAVLVLEADGGAAAKRVLASLPLVKARLIEFEVDELVPYTGFARLFGPTARKSRRRT